MCMHAQRVCIHVCTHAQKMHTSVCAHAQRVCISPEEGKYGGVQGTEGWGSGSRKPSQERERSLGKKRELMGAEAQFPLTPIALLDLTYKHKCKERQH